MQVKKTASCEAGADNGMIRACPLCGAQGPEFSGLQVDITFLGLQFADFGNA